MPRNRSAAEVLDETDHALLRELRADPRASVLSISERVGMSRQVVQQRLSRLLDERIVRVAGLVDPALLGRPLLAKLRITVLRRTREVAEELANDPRINWVVVLASGNQLIVTVSVPLPRDLSEFVDDHVRTLDGVDEVEVDIITAVYTPTSGAAAAEPWLGARSESGFDDTDLTIIEQLREDGRTPFTRLGEMTGLSTASARQRALRLLGTGIVRLHALAEPEALGLHARAEAHVRVDRDSTRAAATISTLPNANYVCRAVGTSDIHAEFYCSTEEELLEAVAAMREVQGVRSWTLHRYREVVYANPVWA